MLKAKDFTRADLISEFMNLTCCRCCDASEICEYKEDCNCFAEASSLAEMSEEYNDFILNKVLNR